MFWREEKDAEFAQRVYALGRNPGTLTNLPINSSSEYYSFLKKLFKNS